jgi:hypothetical protein
MVARFAASRGARLVVELQGALLVQHSDHGVNRLSHRCKPSRQSETIYKKLRVNRINVTCLRVIPICGRHAPRQLARRDPRGCHVSASLERRAGSGALGRAPWTIGAGEPTRKSRAPVPGLLRPGEGYSVRAGGTSVSLCWPARRFLLVVQRPDYASAATAVTVGAEPFWVGGNCGEPRTPVPGFLRPA